MNVKSANITTIVGSDIAPHGLTWGVCERLDTFRDMYSGSLDCADGALAAQGR